MDTAYYSLEAMAAALALPKSWLRDEADEGRIPCLRVGARRMFDLQAVRAALAQQAATVAVESRKPEGERHEQATESTSA